MEQDKIHKQKKFWFWVIFIGLVAFVAGSFWEGDEYSDGEYFNEESQSGENCNVAVFSVNGYLSTYEIQPPENEFVVSSSEEIVAGLRFAEEDPDVKAIMLSVDSSGGDGVAGEEIANALKVLSKPNLAVIRGVGASAAYWAATGADKIYASKISDVGSIGVTFSYLEQSLKDVKEGYKYIELVSAKYKDTGNPSKPLTEEERAIIMSDLEKTHKVFVENTAVNRNLDIKEVEKLANGLTYVGEDALKYGLIDEIGDIISATEYIEEKIGEKAEICWY